MKWVSCRGRLHSWQHVHLYQRFSCVLLFSPSVFKDKCDCKSVCCQRSISTFGARGATVSATEVPRSRWECVAPYKEHWSMIAVTRAAVCWLAPYLKSFKYCAEYKWRNPDMQDSFEAATSKQGSLSKPSCVPCEYGNRRDTNRSGTTTTVHCLKPIERTPLI